MGPLAVTVSEGEAIVVQVLHVWSGPEVADVRITSRQAIRKRPRVPAVLAEVI